MACSCAEERCMFTYKLNQVFWWWQTGWNSFLNPSATALQMVVLTMQSCISLSISARVIQQSIQCFCPFPVISFLHVEIVSLLSFFNTFSIMQYNAVAEYWWCSESTQQLLLKGPERQLYIIAALKCEHYVIMMELSLFTSCHFLNVIHKLNTR